MLHTVKSRATRENERASKPVDGDPGCCLCKDIQYPGGVDTGARGGERENILDR